MKQRTRDMTPAEIFAKARNLTARIRERRGTTVGIACEQGRFRVTETAKIGRKYKTEPLTDWQTYAECLAYMETLA